MKTNASMKLLSIAALALITTSIAHAANYTWVGANGTTWNTSNSNWSGAPANPWDITNGPSNLAFFTSTANQTAIVSGTVYANGMTLSQAGTFALSGGTIQLAGTTPTITTSGAGGNLSIASTLAGSVGFTKTGGNTLTLSGNNTYTGVTNLIAGRLVVGHANALGSTADGTTASVSAGAIDLQVQGGITVVGETVTLNPTGTGQVYLSGAGSGTGTWDGNVVLAGNATAGFRTNPDAIATNMTVGSNSTDTITGSTGTFLLRGVFGTGTINSAINIGAMTLSKTDASTWVIASNNNDFTGNVTVSSGILSFGVIANSGSNSSIGAGTGITLGQNQAGATGRGTLRFTGASGGSSNRTILINNGAAGGSGVIENTVAGQTLTLSGAVTTAVSGNASTLTLTGAGNGVLSGNISSAAGMALEKTGNGTWTVSGTNSYGGVTTVSAGTLLINGNQSGAAGNVTVSAGATLGGNGTIGGATSIADTAILAPGTVADATETLTLNNSNLVLSGLNSKINLDIAGASAGSFDRVLGIAAFTLNGDVTFTLTGTYGTASWDVFDFTSKSANFDTVTLAGSYSGSLTRVSDTWTGTIGGQDWTFEQTTGVLSVIPEPSSIALLLGGLGALALLRRRRA